MKTVLAYALGAGLLATPALAELDICNESTSRLSLAVGDYRDGAWTSSGWWVVDPNACVTPISGPLLNRYYYYRATTPDGPFIEGETYFCVSQDVFDAPGQGNCAARGFAEVGFATLDTGSHTDSYRLTLRDSPSAAPRSPAPTTAAPAPGAPPPLPSASVLQPPGTYGDPYAEAATFQQCLSEGDASYCSFHASGTKFFVYDDGRTPGHVFSTLRELWPGAPIAVEGDLEAIYDRTADVVLRSATPRPWTEADALLERMQGTWYAVDDPAERFNILGAERESSYDDAYISLEYLSVRDQCDDFAGAGPYLYARDEETGDDFCYVIDSVGDYRMTLMYLPDGHFLEYRNLD